MAESDRGGIDAGDSNVCSGQLRVPAGKLQPRSKLYKRLLNKPYVNEVTLRWQKPPLKCCWPLDIWHTFLKGLNLSIL